MNVSTPTREENPPRDTNSDGSPYQVAWSQHERDDEWDDFVSTRPAAHHEQTSRWSIVKRHEGWKAIRVIHRKQDQIVGGTQLLFHRIRPFGVVGYVPHGPCLAEASHELAELSVSALLETARRVGVWFLVVHLPYLGGFILPLLKLAGFQPHPKNWPPVAMMAATSLIDLSLDEDEILARMRKTTRQSIQLGLCRGVRVREGGKQDLNLFYDLMLATCRRRGEAPVPRDREFFHRMWREYSPRGWVRLAIAEYLNEPVCAELSVPFSDACHLWKFGWSGAHRSQRVSAILRWDSILWAKQKGFKQLDLVQIDPEIAAALDSGEPVPSALRSRRLYGSTLHKTGFGGQVAHLPGAYSCFLNPFLRYAYSAFGARLLRKERFTQALGRTAERVWGGSAGT